MAVDEPRDRAEPAAVDLLDVAVEPSGELAHAARRPRSSALAEDERVLDDVDLAERRAAQGRLVPRRRHELREVADEQPRARV